MSTTVGVTSHYGLSYVWVHECVCIIYLRILMYMNVCVFMVVPRADDPCNFCRGVEEKHSGGKQNRRGCRSSASPPPVYPWLEGRRCPAIGSPGTRSHTHARTTTHTHTHHDRHTHGRTRDAGQQTSIARRCKHVHMRTCEDREHAGKCINQSKGYTNVRCTQRYAVKLNVLTQKLYKTVHAHTCAHLTLIHVNFTAFGLYSFFHKKKKNTWNTLAYCIGL